jgi:glyceraldehyde-3-phosphate dehydrogenase (NADP+)
MLIQGKWEDRERRIEVRNPFTNEVIDTVPWAQASDMEKAIDSALVGFRINRSLPSYRRIEILQKAARIMEERKEELARTISCEGGKTIREARKEILRAINTITIAGEEARRIIGETIPFDSFRGGEKRVGYYLRFPIGIIGAITPFNDPLNLVAHKLGPAIAGGNSVVLKPATATPLSALKLGQILLEAGLPSEVLNIITGRGDEIGEVLVTHPKIRMITFTGGTEAGLEIVRKAGLKKIGMELGSNSPVIVMEDANLQEAVSLSVSGAFWAAGQNCIGVQRIYIHEKIYSEFEEMFVKHTLKMKVGDPLKEDTDMGPMISEAEAKRIESWIEEAVEKGAKVLTGGRREGALYFPTVVCNVPEEAKIAKEEVFAPVVSLFKVRSLDEAIEKSNRTSYGLHAAIFTKSIDNAFKAIHGLDCGGVIVNDSTDYRLDSMPFGGVKLSGLGREGIKFALLEMTEPKVICFNL